MNKTEQMQEKYTLVPIPNFSKNYLADVNNGRIWSKKSERWMTTKPNRNGYVMTTFIDDFGEKHQTSVHSIIMSASMGVTRDWWIKQGLSVDHINTVKDDNRIENLKLVSHKGQFENVITKTRMGQNVNRFQEAEVRDILTRYFEYEKTGEKRSTFIHQIAAETGRLYHSIHLILKGERWGRLHQEMRLH